MTGQRKLNDMINIEKRTRGIIWRLWARPSWAARLRYALAQNTTISLVVWSYPIVSITFSPIFGRPRRWWGWTSLSNTGVSLNHKLAPNCAQFLTPTSLSTSSQQWSPMICEWLWWTIPCLISSTIATSSQHSGSNKIRKKPVLCTMAWSHMFVFKHWQNLFGLMTQRFLPHILTSSRGNPQYHTTMSPSILGDK